MAIIDSTVEDIAITGSIPSSTGIPKRTHSPKPNSCPHKPLITARPARTINGRRINQPVSWACEYVLSSAGIPKKVTNSRRDI